MFTRQDLTRFERVGDAGERLDGDLGQLVDRFGLVAESRRELSPGVKWNVAVGVNTTAAYSVRISSRRSSTFGSALMTPQ